MANKKVKGVAGLLFFAVLGFIYSFVLLVLSLFEPIGNLPKIITLSLVILYGYTLKLIYREKKEAPKWIIISVWCSVIIRLLVSLFSRTIRKV